MVERQPHSVGIEDNSQTLFSKQILRKGPTSGPFPVFYPNWKVLVSLLGLISLIKLLGLIGLISLDRSGKSDKAAELHGLTSFVENTPLLPKVYFNYVLTL